MGGHTVGEGCLLGRGLETVAEDAGLLPSALVACDPRSEAACLILATGEGNDERIHDGDLRGRHGGGGDAREGCLADEPGDAFGYGICGHVGSPGGVEDAGRLAFAVW